MAGKIFINYRRADAPDSAGRLDDVLEDAFSREVVFKDVDSIALGDDFEAVLGREVAACDVFLAVIGPRWLELIEARARDPKDFVRVEIRAALTEGKRVIPVLVQGAEMPPPGRLPDEIRPLANRNAISLRPERFKGDARGLITSLQAALAEAEADRSRTAAERAAAEEKRRAQDAAEARQRAEVQARAAQQAAAGLSPAEIRKAEELANWEFIKPRRDMAEHRDHLARFPGGVTDLYARTALAEMAWAALGPAPDEATLTAFLDEFPKAPQAAEARTRRDALRAAAAERAAEAKRRAAETAAWAQVAASEDTTAIEAFLAAWPGGAHAADAQARLNELHGGGRFGRRALLKGLAYGVGGTAVVGSGLATFVRGAPIWRLLNDRSVHTLAGHTDNVNHIAVTSNSRMVVSSEYSAVNYWDIESGRKLNTRNLSLIIGLAPDGRVAFVKSLYKTNRLLIIGPLSGGLKTLDGHTDDISCAAVTPDGRTAISGSWNGTLKVWDIANIATGRELHTLTGHTAYVPAIAVTPDGRTAISGSRDKTLKVWDIATGGALRTLTGHADAVLAVALTPDGRYAISGSHDKTLKVWDIATGRELRTLTGHTDWVRAVAVTPDGRTAVSGSDDNTLKVWDIATGRRLRTLTGHTGAVYAVAVTPDGRTAISGGSDRTLKVWDLSDLPR